MAGLRKYIRPYYSYMLLAMFIKFFGALVELLIPYLLETILDDVVPTGSRRGILLTAGLWCSAPPCVSRRTLWQTACPPSAPGKLPWSCATICSSAWTGSPPAAGRADPALRCVPSHQ